jgi:putative ABC transport system permease protein
MMPIREFLARVTGAVGRRRRDRALGGLNDELQFHLEMMEQQFRREGMSATAARREARARLGGVTQVSEAYEDQRRLPALDSLIQDARYGVRMLIRTPGFTIAALLTLALGIGANTAIFSIVNAVLIRPLPYVDPDRLVMFGDHGAPGTPSNIDFTTFHDYQERNQTFETMTLMRSWLPTLVAGGEAERLPAVRVSWNFFSLLGVRPALGRDFLLDEDRPGRWRVLMLSDGLWRRRFNADPSVIGRTIKMNDVDFQIVGVMPAGFEELISGRFYAPAQLWAPIGYDTTLREACRGCQHLMGFGRLRTGITDAQAVADLNNVRGQLLREHPKEYAARQVDVSLLSSVIAGPVRGPLLVLFVAVGFVMLIACANVANLLLSRAMNRTREMAVRAALGAGRRRLIRQLLTESTILGIAGGGLGLLFAGMSIRSVASIAPVSIPRLDRSLVDGSVLVFTVGMSVLTGIAFGLVPALRASVLPLRESLTADPRTTIGSGATRARQLLVVGDLALALVLLTGAGLMLKSVQALMDAQPGFNSDGVLTAQFSLVGEAYREDSAVVVFGDRVLEKVKALPGVQSAALAGQVPMGQNYDTWGFHIEGMTKANPSEDPSVQRYSVTPEYFRTMQIPLLRGRLIEPSDVANGLAVVVISEATAKLWGGTDPIGRRVRIGGPTSPLRTVVGIVGDVRHSRLDERVSLGMYLPQTQVTDSFLVLTVKSAADPQHLTEQIRGILHGLDPTVPVYAVARLDDLLATSFADRRFVMRLLGAFSFLAVLLAAIGLYGVVSYTVTQRTRELGLRVALGATPLDILGLVFAGGLATVGAGLAVGVVAAFVLTNFLESLLFNVRATDPWTMAAAVVSLAVVATVAHWLPARRAVRVDPVVALRQE